MTDPTPAASEHAPVYAKLPHDDGWATQLWMITCDEGWRTSIVCERMYEWAADWLLGVLGRQPYAPNHRPGAVPDQEPAGGDRG